MQSDPLETKLRNIRQRLDELRTRRALRMAEIEEMDRTIAEGDQVVEQLEKTQGELKNLNGFRSLGFRP